MDQTIIYLGKVYHKYSGRGGDTAPMDYFNSAPAE